MDQGAPALTACFGIAFYEIRDARICLIILAWMDKAEYYKGYDMGGARWSFLKHLMGFKLSQVELGPLQLCAFVHENKTRKSEVKKVVIFLLGSKHTINEIHTTPPIKFHGHSEPSPTSAPSTG
jgi:hypothetical protein